MEEYIASIRQVILDPTSGVFTSRYEGTWQVGVARPSGVLRGPEGDEWILIEYRVETGHWVTAYQPRVSLAQELGSAKREQVRWLRGWQSTNE